MGVVNSKPGEGEGLFLRDQNRFSVAALSITNNRNRTFLNISPNSFPASRYSARRDAGDDAVIEYIQDPESVSSGGPPSFLIRLSNDEELIFNFTFILRQAQVPPSIYNVNNASSITPTALADTNINGLTFIFASSSKELENLVTREFHANPNLHKNPQVDLVGDYSTGGSPSVQFQWSWKWTPPKTEDRGGGWRTSCSFVEYDQRAHRLETLANFSFWVQNSQRALQSPKSPSPRMELGAPPKLPPRLRVPSSQSIESRVSDSGEDLKEPTEYVPPKSPIIESIPEYGLGLSTSAPSAPSVSSQATTLAGNAVKVDLGCPRPGEDLSQTEDGPLFRATMKSLEQRTGNMRAKWKKVLKRAEAALEAQVSCNNAMSDLMESLREASSSNANAVQPAIDHYFDRIAKEILIYERSNTTNIQKLIIDPIAKLYNIDIKQAETKRKDFEEESKEYYQYVGKYLGQRQDSLKEKKRAETDIKYQSKRRNFELKRFDYSSFMQDLHGGRKDQEVLSNLTKYADAQAQKYLDTARRIETMIPQLEALSFGVKEADKEFQLQRTERETKRRLLEKSKTPYDEPPPSQILPTTPSNGSIPRAPPSSDSELPGRKSSIAPIFQSAVNPPAATSLASIPSSIGTPQSPEASQSNLPVGSPQPSKFKGIRDLEDKDHTLGIGLEPGSATHRKEGLLWALSRPGSHADPKGLNKQAWHKFWIVLDQGKLSEYTNWKQKLDLHMDPIDLRVASVREARNAERRFCFEVITPHYTRVYQATSEEDMKTWIAAINNALQSAVETVGKNDRISTDSLPGSTRRDIASVLTGKSTSVSGIHRNTYSSKTPTRHATVGDRPTYRRDEPSDDGRLLQQVRDCDAGNKVCADCGSESKVDWVSINLGIVICIECSGIHRSLGTHISKVRSLTLDTTSFTPDIVEILLKVGNRVSNMIWEAKMDKALKPGPASTREQRLHFITSKYGDRAFVAPISPTLSHYATAEETLLASIKKNDIQNVLYALALGADPNSKDRSRGTHAVFLALAAADPASPSASASPAASPGHRPSTPQPSRKPFPVAELLLQNGADLPTLPAPIPLSSSARLYLEHKADQRAGKRSTAVGGGQPHHGDTLTALPHISAGNGSTPAERAKEREARLQKRVSAGGRLVKSPYADSPESRRAL
ncbi:ARF GTPase-like protein activator [Aaosphaeria arxii CBS 175.79]|uniref:ADP-ribosylation factor GTPase-activating protein n=1 Tax=Aaosphaeria arxii CBS 175.79 TaxID=1450172 RepID=A0A6A5XRV8_9PLEO|nr:ARF GTPase-like protein activator [Aaosphaeria arxii CBS 175.79]KAF2015922.1 ARF GTPase-like protein activator [Aaosphaeria arxii CBS 175.79]